MATFITTLHFTEQGIKAVRDTCNRAAASTPRITVVAPPTTTTALPPTPPTSSTHRILCFPARTTFSRTRIWPPARIRPSPVR
jgi:hypothetical protein